ELYPRHSSADAKVAPDANCCAEVESVKGSLSVQSVIGVNTCALPVENEARRRAEGLHIRLIGTAGPNHQQTARTGGENRRQQVPSRLRSWLKLNTLDDSLTGLNHHALLIGAVAQFLHTY